MKKKIILPLMCSMLLGTTVYAADGFVIEFDRNENAVIISGNVGASKGTLVTVSMAKNSTGEIGSNNLPSYMYLHETADGGALDISIPMSADVISGKYDVYFDSTEGNDKYSFMIVNGNDETTASVIDSINSASSESAVKSIISDTENASKIGIDLDNTAVKSGLDYIAAICYENKGEYTADTLSEAVNEGLACALVKYGDDFDSVMLNYAEYFGTTYAEYSKKSDKEKSLLSSMLKAADLGSEPLSDLYIQMSVTAEVVMAETWGDLKESVVKYADDIGIDMGEGSDYADVSSSKQYKVFVYMFENRDSIKSFEDIRDAFDDGIEDASKTTSSGSSSGGGGGGGGSSSGGSTISSGKLPAAATDPTPVVTPNTTVQDEETASSVTELTDISSHWAKDYINALAALGVVSGYEDNTYRPDAGVTRAEFVKMAVSLFGIDAAGNADFSDVKESDWFYGYVSKAVGAEIVNGTENGFMPHSGITRQDAAVIIYRLGDRLKLTKDGGTAFNDSALISDYASEAVSVLSASGIISGDDGNFRPQGSITRAETAAILWRAFEKSAN